MAVVVISKAAEDPKFQLWVCSTASESVTDKQSSVPWRADRITHHESRSPVRTSFEPGCTYFEGMAPASLRGGPPEATNNTDRNNSSYCATPKKKDGKRDKGPEDDRAM